MIHFISICFIAMFAGWGFMDFVSKTTRLPLWCRLILLGIFSVVLSVTIS